MGLVMSKCLNTSVPMGRILLLFPSLTLTRGVQKIFKRVLAEKNVELHNCKEVVDVRDPPEGVPGAMGTLSCADGTEASRAC